MLPFTAQYFLPRSWQNYEVRRLGVFVMAVRAEVRGLFVYPLKSCKPIALHEAELSPQGLKFDRHWMVVTESGRAQTQRDIPLLSQIQTELRGDLLVLSRPGHGSTELSLLDDGQPPTTQQVQTIKVWKDECDTVAASDAASRWLTQATQSSTALKIVRMAPGFVRAQSSPAELGADTQVQFADAAPFLIANEASLDRLNRVLLGKGEAVVPMNRFRPNIVIRGLEPFGEHRQHVLGNAVYRFNFRMPCERCVVPTIDQETSIPHPRKEPFATLRDLNPRNLERRQPLFGQYATLQDWTGGKIAVGDLLHA
jgi:uncharacterized protein